MEGVSLSQGRTLPTAFDDLVVPLAAASEIQEVTGLSPPPATALAMAS
jgi:hypothetical protein